MLSKVRSAVAGIGPVRRAYRRLFPPSYKVPVRDDYFGHPILGNEAGNDLIADLVAGDQPLMVTRIGRVELNCLVNYLEISSGDREEWDESVKKALVNIAGFFPPTADMLERYCVEYAEDLTKADVVEVWFNINEDVICRKYCREATLMRFKSVEPYYYDSPWSAKLRDRMVLVVHPFEETIRQQHQRRELLFADDQVLPPFELETVKAVQSIAGNRTDYDDWFQARDCMCEQISKKSFDIALIGAGAYGPSLASFVKGMGKKAIHMGGATQILFGIKGRRWDRHKVISKYYNNHWVRPSVEETPPNFELAEGGSYW